MGARAPLRFYYRLTQSFWIITGAIIGLLIGAPALATLAASVDESLDYLGFAGGLVSGGYLGALIGDYCHRRISSGSE
jgi:hypothetical protein